VITLEVQILIKVRTNTESKNNPAFSGIFFAGELVLRWNQILPSLLKTYEKLKKLGFTYQDGKVLIKPPKFNGKGEVYE